MENRTMASAIAVQSVLEWQPNVRTEAQFLSDPGRPGPIYVSGCLEVSERRCVKLY